MATDIFKFVSVRPPQVVKPDKTRKLFPAYPKGKRSPFHVRVTELEATDDKREKAAALADEHLKSDKYTALMDRLTDEEPRLNKMVRRASSQKTLEKATDILKKGLGKTPAAYLKAEGKTLRDEVWDGVYSQALVPDHSPEDRDPLYSVVRSLHFIELVTEEKSKSTPVDWSTLSDLKPTIPSEVVPLAPDVAEPGDDDDGAKTLEKVRSLRDRLRKTKSAIDDLRNNHRIFQRTKKVPDRDTEDGCKPEPRRLSAHEFAASLERVPEVSDRVLSLLPALRNFAGTPQPKSWIFRKFGLSHLKRETLDVLQDQKSALEERHPVEVVETLERRLADEIDEFIDRLSPAQMEKIAHTDEINEVFTMAPVMYSMMKPIPFLPAKPPQKPLYPTPKGRGIRPLGIGDLLIVKEELLKYTAGEVAHIENVLQGEYKERKHRRLRQTEEIIITETEQLEESEKDLQTTERFELHKETEKTIQSDLEFGAGVEVSGSYGMVKFSAYADFATSTSREESNRSATSYAKEVTERSIQRIQTRAREERTRRTLEEFEEKNKHGIDNKGGGAHIIGIYRWVDKYYTARIHNYGRRLMLEFIVPEPAAFYIHSEARRSAEGITMTPPEEPKVYAPGGYRRLRPSDLNSTNYMKWVSKYDVQDVEPYPPASVTVGMAFAEATGQRTNVPMGKAYKELQVPDGYVADWSTRSVGWYGTDDNWLVGFDVLVGRGRNGDVSGLEGIIPVSFLGIAATFVGNIVIGCDRKNSTLADWQLKTFTSIMNAYNRKLAEYNEHVAAANIQQGIEIQGQNPGINRSIEKDELRKGCLRIITDNFAHTEVSGAWRHHELFNAINPAGSYGFPEFDVEEAMVEGKMIQFFEQAFEWENLTYSLYPYFWGRKNNWLETFPLNDTDPKFRDFLRAGAARVVVPVHPNYNRTVLHYLATNEIWNGGEPPTLYDPLYISIVEDLRAATDEDGGEVVGEWEVKLPTTLVYLQENAQLPDYS